jgi:hypothetical protein
MSIRTRPGVRAAEAIIARVAVHVLITAVGVLEASRWLGGVATAIVLVASRRVDRLQAYARHETQPAAVAHQRRQPAVGSGHSATIAAAASGVIRSPTDPAISLRAVARRAGGESSVEAAFEMNSASAGHQQVDVGLRPCPGRRRSRCTQCLWRADTADRMTVHCLDLVGEVAPVDLQAHQMEHPVQSDEGVREVLVLGSRSVDASEPNPTMPR